MAWKILELMQLEELYFENGAINQKLLRKIQSHHNSFQLYQSASNTA